MFNLKNPNFLSLNFQMASSSQSALIDIDFHCDGVFERNPITYDYGMISKVEKVDIMSMDYSQFLSFLQE